MVKENILNIINKKVSDACYQAYFFAIFNVVILNDFCFEGFYK